jgi:outer membrane receptor protein involved in Fe transport
VSTGQSSICTGRLTVRKLCAIRSIVRSFSLCVLAIAVVAPIPARAAEPSEAAAADPSSAPASDQPSSQSPTGATKPAGKDRLAEVVVSASGLEKTNQELDEARDRNLLPKLGSTQYSIDQQDLQTLPQGKNTPLDKVVLQIPGVSYDSAVSNPDFHVRNEYANVQYRINGIQLPDGVSALGPVLGTDFVGSMSLLDGTLPAQYGLRTAGVLDITTKSQFDTGGNLDIYAGTWATVSPSVEYGGSEGTTQYFLSGRYLQSDQGLENAMPTADPIHDHTSQERFFGYGSTLIGDSDRLTYMTGAWVGRFQIPDVLGEEPLGDYGPSTLSSADINEHEKDRYFFALVALQTHRDDLDTQLSAYTRYASINFVPDPYYDLAFNDVAANVVRKSLLNGLQFDAAYRLSDAHTLRTGLDASIEHTQVDDLATVLPVTPDGAVLPTPLTVNDYRPKTGWNVGIYAQDEWRIRPNLTLNTGVRFDQLNQFVSANQVSPRIVLVYEPLADTSLHAGVSRYFTPPMQAQATPNNIALFQNTTQQAAIPLDDPVRPERATYVDIGLEQKVTPAFNAGADVYYKHGTDMLDDGTFGNAVVLSQFNYALGFSKGAEFKLNYQYEGLRIYANYAHEITKAKDVVSNQYLIADPVELAFMASNYTYASDAQTNTASAGASYRWGEMFATLDGIYGSGLRAGFANEQHSPDYAQFNAAVGRNFYPWRSSDKPLTVRLSAVNLFDRVYLLRAATGVGEFAPQYGPRRGVFVELTQQF